MDIFAWIGKTNEHEKIIFEDLQKANFWYSQKLMNSETSRISRDRL